MANRLTVPVGPRDHIIGPHDAPVVLVEYGDYQCPHCRQAHGIVKALRHRFPTTLAYVFRNFPLVELHPDALRAAETAEWAGLARRFWPMHDYLFEHQDSLEPEQLLAAATRLELDRRQLQVAWREHALRMRVAEDIESGRESGVSGTPTFFINGTLYEDSWDVNDLADALRQAGASER